MSIIEVHPLASRPPSSVFPRLATLRNPKEAVSFAREAIEYVPCDTETCLSEGTGALYCPRCALIEILDDLLEFFSD